MIRDAEHHLGEEQPLQELEQRQEDLGPVCETHTRSGSEISTQREAINQDTSLREESINQDASLGNEDATRVDKSLWEKLCGENWNALEKCRNSQRALEVRHEETSKELQQHLHQTNRLEVELEQRRKELEKCKQESIRLREDHKIAKAAVAKAKIEGQQMVFKIVQGKS